VYIVVAAGEITCVPVGKTGPTPELISTELALETFQLNVEDPPTIKPSGLAVKTLISGGVPITIVGDDGGDNGGDAGSGVEAAIIDISVVAVLLPAALVAEIVYFVVADGEIDVDPDKATLPIPGSIVTDSALVTAQVNVDDCPGLIALGLAEN
jgi:cation transporter-like permease